MFKTIGPYRLVELLGAGGVGRVYLGEHRFLGVRHAIKVLHEEMTQDQEQVERFLHEARFSARLQHPHVVRVVNADRDSTTGVLYIAMEYLRCLPMDALLAHVPLSPHRAVRYVWQILGALDHAHEEGGIHRDVKPDNILITRGDHALLTDFGLVREVVPDEAAPEPLMGTPSFMPPEQWSGGALDRRTDVYAAGVTLFHALSRRFPYEGEHPWDVHRAQQAGAQLTLREARPTLDPDLASLVERAIALDPRERYPSAAAFADALSTWWALNPHERLELAEGPALHGVELVEAELLEEARLEPEEPPRDPSGVTRSYRKQAGVDLSGDEGAVTPELSPGLRPPVAIAPGVYWVGRRELGSVFFASPYLRVFTDGEGAERRMRSVLIDPGPEADFQVVRAAVEEVIGDLGRLSLIFINHQDPDVLGSAAELAHRHATRARVMASRETWRLAARSLPRDRALLTERYEGGFHVLPGQRLIPVPSPFCHFVGAVMLYDPQNRVLFSGDLFGGLTAADAHGLIADESDWVGVQAFHEIYMPSNAALRRAIAAIRALDPPVEMIAPQHGRILTGEVMRDFMERLERLKVGLDNLDDRRNDPSTLPMWNVVMDRVLKVAIDRVGPAVLELLAVDRFVALDLEIDRDAGYAIIQRNGKATLEQAVDTICLGLPEGIANIIKYEAILSAEELGLPVPRISLEEVSDDHLGAPLPPAFRPS